MSAIFRCDVGDGSKNKDFKVSFDFSRVRKSGKNSRVHRAQRTGKEGRKKKKEKEN